MSPPQRLIAAAAIAILAGSIGACGSSSVESRVRAKACLVCIEFDHRFDERITTRDFPKPDEPEPDEPTTKRNGE